MRCTDTNSKGKVVFQTKQGTYFALTEEELLEAVGIFDEVVQYLAEDLPRKKVDSRNY